ncbi:transcription factor MYB1R1-like [Quercus suber]|uniref:transcription factor MYB1R1-like n=1 Tax=Quercus suber TaxID=58331 RepID=UPI0032DEF854
MSEELLAQLPIPKNNVDNHNPMKKSVSMGNPSSEKVENNDSEDDAEDLADGVSQRKRWTEEEHKIFLIGLKKLGRGDWKGISQKFVTTRSPSQVASHAQKYFLRKATIDKKKPRSSVFDVSLNEPELAPKDFSVSHMEKSDTETSSLGASSSQALALVNRYPHVSIHNPSLAQMRPPVFGAPNYHLIPSISNVKTKEINIGDKNLVWSNVKTIKINIGDNNLVVKELSDQWNLTRIGEDSTVDVWMANVLVNLIGKSLIE